MNAVMHMLLWAAPPAALHSAACCTCTMLKPPFKVRCLLLRRFLVLVPLLPTHTPAHPCCAFAFFFHLIAAILTPPCTHREYRHYWFFLNLQLAIDRALLGGQQSNASLPAGLTLKLKPFPWPAKQEDIGAASAAALLNLLLVYAFMAPTRAVVGSIVREKELRLREGMRILGLSVGAAGH